jgi:hypothetical protein
MLHAYLLLVGTKASPEDALKMLIISSTTMLAQEIDVPPSHLLRGLLRVVETKEAMLLMAGFRAQGPQQ